MLGKNKKEESSNKKVEIFSTPTCHFCNLAKNWFKEKGIAYTDFDVSKDALKRKEMVELTGQLGVPVIKIGEEVVIGFNPQRISEILSLTV